MHLMSPIENVDSFLGRDDGIAIEVSRTLFELREVFNCFQSSLRSKQPLNVDSAQARRLDAAPILLWSNVPHQMRGAVCMAVYEIGRASCRERAEVAVVGWS